MDGSTSIVVPGWAYVEGVAEVRSARDLYGASPVAKQVAVSAASYAHAYAQ